MPSERDPLLKIPPRQQDATVQNSDLVEEGSLGPLEISRSNRWAILIGIWTANFLSSLNTTLVATLMPSISSEFNQSHEVSWLGTAYLLAVCTFTPIYGRLCDAMGRRGAIQAALLISVMGTLGCGLSPSMNFLIAARFLSGIGGGGISTTSSVITSDMFTLRSRGLAQGIGNIFTAVGMGLGGPLGGLISDIFGWRTAFLVQMPLLLVSFALVGYNLHYVTPGNGKTTRGILKRIDYGGVITTLVWIFSALLFLSYHYNEQLPWDNPRVASTFVSAIVFFVSFIVIELKVAVEPVFAPFLLRQKIPVLVGISNFLVSFCNFTITYFFPMWFQTVMLTSASIAGLHLLPTSILMPIGSMFAGWSMHVTGKYRFINLLFGVLPFIAVMLVTTMSENSSPARLWFSITPFGLGNSAVYQATLVALLAHIPQSAVAVGTGFAQLFRGVGQVCGVAVSSAVFQSVLDNELRMRIHGPDANEMIKRIRESAVLVLSLPPDLQRAARDSYDRALKTVFTMAMCSTLTAYIVRLLIPDKSLDEPHPSGPPSNAPQRTAPSNIDSAASSGMASPCNTPPDCNGGNCGGRAPVLRAKVRKLSLKRPRTLSGYRPVDGGTDLEANTNGPSAP